MVRTVDVWNPLPVKGHWFNLLIGYPIISNPFSGDHRIFSHSTAGFQTMEHILPMPSTNNRGSGKWPFLEVRSLKLTTYPWKEVFPKRKLILPTPIVQGQSVSFRESTEGSAFLTSNDWEPWHIPSPRLRRCVYHSLEAAYCIGVLPLRPTAVVFGANMTKAWQKRLPL